MNVFSLFDGMSCGQIALKKLGIKVDNYYASEIDKYAIEVTQANFPNTIQLGDVTKLDTSTLPKIDLIMGGSPCQGFSRANSNALAFDDPRSALFFEFVRCIEELNPTYFLLENVNMKKEWLDTITEYMGVEGIKINSSLVSAQNRVRWYWTNIPDIEQPKEKGIVLKDILEDTNYIEDNVPEKSQTIKAQYYKSSRANFENDMKKGGTFGATGIKEINPNKPNQVNPSKKANGVQPYIQDRVFHEDGKSHALTESFASRTNVQTTTSYNGITNIKKGTSGKSWFFEQQTYSKDSKKTTSLKAGGGSGKIPKVIETSSIQIGVAADVNGHDVLKRVYSANGKSPTLNTCGGGNREPKVAQADFVWRKLTPLECMRLQTVPDDYLMPVSNTRKYMLLGNGWTVDVICHILKNMDLKKGQTSK